MTANRHQENSQTETKSPDTGEKRGRAWNLALPRVQSWALTTVALLALLSGAAALSYEVIWTRHMELVFGITQSAVSTTVAAFMGGMALGSWLYARLASKTPRPLMVYGLLEMAIGIYSFTVPELLSSVGGIYRFVGVTPSGSVLTLWRLASSFVILAPATLAMGATFPALVASMRHRPDDGNVGAVLYGLNTLGAVVGASVTGLVLFPTAGLTLPAQAAAATSIMAGLAALWINRKAGWVQYGDKIPSMQSTPSSGSTAGPDSTWNRPGVQKPLAESRRPDQVGTWRPWTVTPDSLLTMAGLVAAFLGGVSALGAEVVWNRILGLLLDGTLYGFSVLLSGYLAGIALGSLAMAKFLDKHAERTQTYLAWIHILSSLVSLLFIAVVSITPAALARIASSQHSAPAGFFLKALVLGSLLLLPTVFFGAAFPTSLKLVARKHDRGKAAGWTAAASTLGGILGALGAGLWLPGLSVSSTGIAVMAAATSLFAGLAVAGLDLIRSAWKKGLSIRALKKPLFVRIGLPILFFGTAAALGPNFHTSRIAAARYAVEDYDHRLGIGTNPRGTLIFEAEGRQTIVTLRRTSQGGFRLRNNGLNEAYHAPTAPHFADVIYYLGALGYALQPNARRALLVGLGSGGTAEILLSSRLQRLDILEIEPKVVEAAKIIYSMLLAKKPHRDDARDLNGDVRINPLTDPRAHIILDDARNYLLRRTKSSPGKYDIIVSQPSHPWLSGMGTIYSREFFHLVSQNLSRKGLFCQWVNLFRMDEHSLNSILATTASVFPHFHVYYTDQDSLVIVASNGPLPIDPSTIERHLEEQSFGDAARRQGIELASFLTSYAFDRNRAIHMAGNAAVITDVRPILEMHLPWTFHGSRLDPPRILAKHNLPFGILDEDLDYQRQVPRTWSRYAEAAITAVKQGRLSGDLAFSIIERAGSKIGVEAWRLTGRLAAYIGDEKRAMSSYERAARAGDARARLLLGRLLADMGHKKQSGKWLESALGTSQDAEARLALATLLLDQDPSRAEIMLKNLRLVPYQDGSILCKSALLLAKLHRSAGDMAQADALISEHLDCNPDSMDGWYLAAWLSAAIQRDDQARIEATKAVRIGWSLAETISNEGRRIAQNGFPRAAERRYIRAVELDPNYKEPYQWMAKAWRKAGRYCKMLDVERTMRANLGDGADEWLESFHLEDTIAERLGRALARRKKTCRHSPADRLE